MKVYVDSSFLMSLYSLDSNSASAASIMRSSGGDHYITVYGELEVVNALELRVFRKELSASRAQLSLKDFESDLREGVMQLRPLTDPIFERARQLSQQTTARLGTLTADLLLVAAAVVLGADCLYTFDQQQRKLAQAVRLKTN
ncbi:MAG TPA: type II toxin-antitoxin system VapC family toxin [Terriglobales bacterium]|nr:type II toxin-antitoxin system VapC family toxin [Terriglobales bacterium]